MSIELQTALAIATGAASASTVGIVAKLVSDVTGKRLGALLGKREPHVDSPAPADEVEWLAKVAGGMESTATQRRHRAVDEIVERTHEELKEQLAQLRRSKELPELTSREARVLLAMYLATMTAEPTKASLMPTDEEGEAPSSSPVAN
jgi:hypothetical protein